MRRSQRLPAFFVVLIIIGLALRPLWGRNHVEGDQEIKNYNDSLDESSTTSHPTTSAADSSVPIESEAIPSPHLSSDATNEDIDNMKVVSIQMTVHMGY